MSTWPTDADRDAAWGDYRDGPHYQPTDRHDVEAACVPSCYPRTPHIARREREAASRALNDWADEMEAACRAGVVGGPESRYGRAGLDLLRQARTRADRIERGDQP